MVHGDVHKGQRFERLNHCFPLAFGSQTYLEIYSYDLCTRPILYALRAPPFNVIGVVYATGNGVDKVVTTAAQVPSTADAQIVSTRLCASFL